MTSVTFDVEVLPEHAQQFARLSGDWNPLHTDVAYAATSPYRKPIIHGAFSAGLVSRMAGMHIPGRDCLLHSMQLRFLAPIIPPARLVVRGTLLSERDGAGSVEVTITDAGSSVRYVTAGYEFSRHASAPAAIAEPSTSQPSRSARSAVLVTGASGAIGGAVCRSIGDDATPLPAAGLVGRTPEEALDVADRLLGGRAVSAIVHCGWPSPDNTRLTRLDEVDHAVAHHVTSPLVQSIALARILATRGTPDAVLIILGSTAADPGRHNYRSPLYSLSKSLLPTLTRILAVELGASGRRCVTIVLDVVEGGMNASISAQARVAHKARIPSGAVPAADEVAAQIGWVLGNRSTLVSGATLSLSGGALP